MTLSEHFAAYACSNILQGNATTITEVKSRILDYITVTSAAETYLDYASLIKKYAQTLTSKTSTSPSELPVNISGFTNGALAHALDYDDGHLWAGVHATGPVIGAAFALINKLNPTGLKLLEAITAGYEIEYRLAKSLGKSHIQKGYHGSCTCGVFGSAIAAGIILDLTQQQMVYAIGLAGLACAGFRQPLAEGQMAKPIQVGYVTERGINAALLAKVGIEGPVQIFEGGSGILPILSDRPKEEIISECLHGLGTTHLINDTYTKLYPCCRYTHFAIESCFEIRKKIKNLNDISNIEVNTFDIAYEATAPNENPQSAAQARFSIHYLVAVALIEGFVGLKDFTSDAIKRQEIAALGKKVTCHSTKEWNDIYPDIRGAEVRITLKDGTVYSHKTSKLAGMPGDHEAAPRKFQNTCSAFFSKEQMNQIECFVNTLHSRPETYEITALISNRNEIEE